MERAKQLGKIDARCILEPAGNLIDHAGRVTYELRGVAIAIHLNGVDSCQRLCDSLGDLRHDIDVAIGEKIGVLHTVVCFRLGLDAGGDALAMCLLSGAVSLTLEARRLCLSLGLGRDAFSCLLGTVEIGVRLILCLDLDLLFAQYMRIIKPHGAIVLTSSGLFTAKLMLHAPEIYKYKLVWVKSKATNFLNAKKQPLRKYEDICVFYKAQPTYNPQMSEGEAYDKGVRKDQLTGSYGAFSPKHVKSDGSRYPTDIVYFKTAESEGAVYHPTQKPVEPGRYLIRTYTNPGDIVLDNACGSGSFCVAAVLEGRSFIGIEKNEDVALFKKQPVDYIDICNQRIKEAKRTFEAEQQAIS